MRSSGFTLLETLVTISLIAALLSLMAPALSSARDSARQAMCGSNIRQLQLANDLHANERSDRYIPGAIDMQTSNLHRWHGVRRHVGEPFDSEAGPISSYLGDGKHGSRVRACPGFQMTLDALEESGDGFERGNGGYGYNNAFVGVARTAGPGGAWVVQTDEHGANRDRFERPANTIAFTDAAFAHAQGVDGLIEYSFAEPNFWPDFPGARPNPSIHFRHGGACNVAWLDGHVSAETRTVTWSGLGFGPDSTALGLGWFGGADSNELFDYD